MARSPWMRSVFQRDTPIGRSSCRRPLTSLSPGCEALEHRQLLSTVAAAPTKFSVPPAAAVRKAASILERDAPAAFAQFQIAMARAEQHSDVNRAEVSALAQDEAVVVQDIESAGLTSRESAPDLGSLQDGVDFALTGSPGFHYGRTMLPNSQIPEFLDSNLTNVPAVFNASGSPTSISPIDQLIDQIEVVANETKLTPAIQSALNRSYNSLNDALGSNAITDLGPGEINRDVLVVYFDGQVNKFLK
jgi:hypothetical protein